MRLDIRNSLIGPDEVAEYVEKLEPYREKLSQTVKDRNFVTEEASILLPDDERTLSEVRRLHEKKASPKLKYVVNVGMGGARLGSKLVYDALLGYKDQGCRDDSVKFLCMETTESTGVGGILDLISEDLTDPEEILIFVLSQSGTTPETVANADHITDTLKKRFPDRYHERIVIITNFDSPMLEPAEKYNFDTTLIEKKIGGRYSVFTQLGLLPHACLQVDISELLRGALEMRNRCLSENAKENYAMHSASVLYKAWKEKKQIHTEYIFAPELEVIGKWYRQMQAESLGKEKDRDGQTVRAGLTPDVAVGSIDHHSTLQLYMSGPENKIFSFLKIDNVERDIPMPEERAFENMQPSFTGKTTKDIMDAIYDGTVQSFVDHSLPFMEVQFDKVNEYEIGQYLQFRMMETIYLGHLLNVNPFDQPGVEAYKVITREILEKK